MRFDVFDFYCLVLRLRLTQCLEGHVDVFCLLVRDGIVDPRNGALVVFPNRRGRQRFFILGERFVANSVVCERVFQFSEPFHFGKARHNARSSASPVDRATLL